jgi:hypothetical protein
VVHDSDFLTLHSVTTDGTTVDSVFTDGFNATRAEPGGWFSAVALAFVQQPAQLPVNQRNSLARATYILGADPGCTGTFIEYANEVITPLHSPPVAINITVDGQSCFPAELVPGWVRTSCADQRPGDCNQDNALDVSDAICLLGFLFLGNPADLPCGDGTSSDSANTILLDCNGDGTLDLSDGVCVLTYLFAGGPPPVLGTECVSIPGCPDVCAPQ